MSISETAGHAPLDWRGLCEELVDIATAHANPDAEAVGYVAATLARARAALAAEPVGAPAGPTDEELDQLFAELNEKGQALGKPFARAVLARWGNRQGLIDSSAAPPAAEGPTFEQLYDLAAEHEGKPVASMQAALARWGRQPAPPAEGEVSQ